MFHILYGWMAGFILSFKVFLGQKLDKLSEKSNLSQKNTDCVHLWKVYWRKHLNGV